MAGGDDFTAQLLWTFARRLFFFHFSVLFVFSLDHSLSPGNRTILRFFPYKSSVCGYASFLYFLLRYVNRNLIIHFAKSAYRNVSGSPATA
jgi:hypothetical protein